MGRTCYEATSCIYSRKPWFERCEEQGIVWHANNNSRRVVTTTFCESCISVQIIELISSIQRINLFIVDVLAVRVIRKWQVRHPWIHLTSWILDTRTLKNLEYLIWIAIKYFEIKFNCSTNQITNLPRYCGKIDNFRENAIKYQC